MAEILHHLGCMKPQKQWDKLPINWCRISAINSINHPKRKTSLNRPGHFFRNPGDLDKCIPPQKNKKNRAPLSVPNIDIWILLFLAHPAIDGKWIQPKSFLNLKFRCLGSGNVFPQKNGGSTFSPSFQPSHLWNPKKNRSERIFWGRIFV